MSNIHLKLEIQMKPLIIPLSAPLTALPISVNGNSFLVVAQA